MRRRAMTTPRRRRRRGISAALNLGALSYGVVCVMHKLKLERRGLPGSDPVYGEARSSPCLCCHPRCHPRAPSPRWPTAPVLSLCVPRCVTWTPSPFTRSTRFRSGSWTRRRARRSGTSVPGIPTVCGQACADLVRVRIPFSQVLLRIRRANPRFHLGARPTN